jgi:hypothetical protein
LFAFLNELLLPLDFMLPVKITSIGSGILLYPSPNLGGDFLLPSYGDLRCSSLGGDFLMFSGMDFL